MLPPHFILHMWSLAFKYILKVFEKILYSFCGNSKVLGLQYASANHDAAYIKLPNILVLPFENVTSIVKM